MSRGDLINRVWFQSVNDRNGCFMGFVKVSTYDESVSPVDEIRNKLKEKARLCTGTVKGNIFCSVDHIRFGGSFS